MHAATAAESLDEQKIGVMRAFSSFVDNAPAGESGAHVGAALSALANTRTGTLYTTRFEIAADEQAKIAPLGNLLFRTVRIDDEI